MFLFFIVYYRYCSDIPIDGFANFIAENEDFDILVSCYDGSDNEVVGLFGLNKLNSITEKSVIPRSYKDITNVRKREMSGRKIQKLNFL